MKHTPALISLLLLGLLSVKVLGQQRMSLDQSIQTALQKNQRIEATSLQVEYYKQIKKTGSDIGKVSATWMHGQYNSLYQDNNLTFTQTIPFPTVIASQLQLGTQQVIGAQKEFRMSQTEIAYEVKSFYYHLLYLDALRSLLRSQDSLYVDFARASTVRYKTGESNLLEKTTAETQLMEIRNQSRTNAADMQIAESRLQAFLRNDVPVEASDTLRKRELPGGLDTASWQTNAQLDYLRQQIIISQKVQRIEQNKLLPDITVGYFNQTLVGVQNINGQDQYYGSTKRFQGFELGLSIPLWFAPGIARGKAAGFHKEIARKNADYFQTNLKAEYRQTLQELDKNQSSLTYYEQGALKNADLILGQARKAYRAGEIGYLEYLQSLRTTLAIRSSYLQSLNQYNQSVIKLEFLLGIL